MQNALLNLVELARVAEKAGLNSVAIQLLLKYVNATANHSFPRFLLSQCYLAVGNLVEALRHLDQVTHFPEDHSSDLLMLRAKIFEELGDYTRSEVFHLQAIEGDGTVFEPRIEYARFLAGCGRLDEALTAIESIEKNCIEMDHDELHELRGNVHRAMHQYRLAAMEFEKCLGSPPNESVSRKLEEVTMAGLTSQLLVDDKALLDGGLAKIDELLKR